MVRPVQTWALKHAKAPQGITPPSPAGDHSLCAAATNRQGKSYSGQRAGRSAQQVTLPGGAFRNDTAVNQDQSLRANAKKSSDLLSSCI